MTIYHTKSSGDSHFFNILYETQHLSFNISKQIFLQYQFPKRSEIGNKKPYRISTKDLLFPIYHFTCVVVPFLTYSACNVAVTNFYSAAGVVTAHHHTANGPISERLQKLTYRLPLKEYFTNRPPRHRHIIFTTNFLVTL